MEDLNEKTLISFPYIDNVSRYKIEYYEKGYIYNGSWILAYPIQEIDTEKTLDLFQEKIYQETIKEPKCWVNGLKEGKEYVFRYTGYIFNEDGSIIEMILDTSEHQHITFNKKIEEIKPEEIKPIKNRKYVMKKYEIEDDYKKMDKMKVFKYGVETAFIVSSFLRIAFTLSNHFSN